MSDKMITLAGVTARTGSDQSVGVVELTTTLPAELNNISGRPIIGTSYKTTQRVLPVVGFAIPGRGTPLIASQYTQKINTCAFLETQLRIPKPIVDAEAEGTANADGSPVSVGSILADELVAAMRAALITIGSQVWYGRNNDVNGFQGLRDFVDPTFVLDAGGASGASSSAYFIWENVQGVHFVWGNNRGLGMALPAWDLRQVETSETVGGVTTVYHTTAYTQGMNGYIGLAANHPKCVVRIIGIDATHPLTDRLISQAISLFPLQFTNSGGLKIFANRDARYLLQVSRTPVSIQNQTVGGAALASGSGPNVTVPNPQGSPLVGPIPSESNGIPLIVTDSLVSTETITTDAATGLRS
jgi:hypothetical protein